MDDPAATNPPPSSAPPPATVVAGKGGSVFGHYRVLTRQPDGAPFELGRGAMGVTYKAVDTNLGSVVALKVINNLQLGSASSRERFSREAKAAAQLSHGNVARVFHLGQEGENSFYAMEFVEGETLEALVRREGPLDPATALRLAAQICRGLQAAHAKGLLHRDLKPANVMLVREQDELVVKIIDFGLVKQLDAPASDRETLSAADDGSNNGPNGNGGGALSQGGFCGTSQFASPEQFDPERAIDARADLYSLGATLWFLLEGRPPFQGSLPQVVMQLLQMPLPLERLEKARPGMPPAVAGVLRRLLAREPEDRPPDAAAARRELLAALAQVPDSTTVAGGLAGAGAGVVVPVSITHLAAASTTGTGAAAFVPDADAPADGEATLLDAPLEESGGGWRPPGAIGSGTAQPSDSPPASAAATPTTVPRGSLPPFVAALALLVLFGCCAAGLWYFLVLRALSPQARIAAETAAAQKALARRDDDAAFTALALLKGLDPKSKFAAENLRVLGQRWRETAANLKDTDPAGSAKLLGKAALVGDAQAQEALAYLKESGTGGVSTDLPAAAALYRQAADQGLSDAQTDLARLYELGQGVPLDRQQAQLWYERAAAQGNLIAQNNLGHLYQTDPGGSRDLAKAMDWYRRAAEAGLAQAQANLGSMYMMGANLPRPDPAQAFAWFEKAAAQDSVIAINNLGVMCENGAGLPGGKPDYARAASYYTRAGDKGYAPAQLNIGGLYMRGLGVPRDLRQAASWYRLAAGQGIVSAQYNLGVLYDQGEGIARDPAQAAMWYRKAIDTAQLPVMQQVINTSLLAVGKDKKPLTKENIEDIEARNGQGDGLLVACAESNLASLLIRGGEGVPKDEKQAVAWMRRAAEAGFATAQTNLGFMCRDGRGGLPRDPAQAAHWWQLGADGGNLVARALLGRAYVEGSGVARDVPRGVAMLQALVEAKNSTGEAFMGNLYRDGTGGVPRDDAKALALFRQSAAQNDDDGQLGLGTLYERGQGVPKNKAEAVKWYTLAAGQNNHEAKDALERLK